MPSFSMKPCAAVTAYCVAWPAARRWNQSGALHFSHESSARALRQLARGDWNAAGIPLGVPGAMTTTRAVLRSAARWARSHLPLHDEKSRGAVVFSSSKGELDALRPHSPSSEYSENDFFGWTPDHPARVLAGVLMEAGASPLTALAPVAACAGGAHAVALGAQLIESGRADWVLCGALEAGLTPLMMAGYKSLGALSKSGVARPFDAARDGFVPREGLALLVLQNAEYSASPHLAHLTGWAMNADATAMTAMQPDGATISRAMEIALRRAEKHESRAVDAVNAHATATLLNDAIEARAISKTLGENATVFANKGATGHWLGAAGALEAALCAMSLQHQSLPPCVGLNEQGSDIAPLDFVREENREYSGKLRRLLSLNYGFGGHIGALVLDAPSSECSE